MLEMGIEGDFSGRAEYHFVILFVKDCKKALTFFQLLLLVKCRSASMYSNVHTSDIPRLLRNVPPPCVAFRHNVSQRTETYLFNYSDKELV